MYRLSNELLNESYDIARLFVGSDEFREAPVEHAYSSIFYLEIDRVQDR